MFSFLLPLIRAGSVGQSHLLSFPDPEQKQRFCPHCRRTEESGASFTPVRSH